MNPLTGLVLSCLMFVLLYYTSATSDINYPCGSDLPEYTVILPRKSVSTLCYGLLYVLANLNWYMLPSGFNLLPKLFVVIVLFSCVQLLYNGNDIRPRCGYLILDSFQTYNLL